MTREPLKMEMQSAIIDGTSEYNETRDDSGDKNMDEEIMVYIILSAILVSAGILILGTWAYIVCRRATRLFQPRNRCRTRTCENPVIALRDQQKLRELSHLVEFPRDRIILGKRCGEGYFAETYHADGLGILPIVNRTRIMVKIPRLSDEGIRAFKRELKILTSIEQNNNIVLLYGACTDRLDVNRPMLLLEFFELGSILEFLLENRDKFRTNSVDFQNSADEPRPASRNHKRLSQRVVDLCRVHFKSKNEGESSCHLLENPTYLSYENISGRKLGEPEYLPKSVKLLLSWSSQVSHGMQYLASKKIIHGNLAARNILLKTNFTVKITNFALAKKLKRDQKFCKRNAGTKSPVRWAAIELLTDDLCSLKSDVWSYGVLMWEMFSLGKEPYNDLGSLTEIYHKLLLNHRLKRPEHALPKIYELMRTCWEFDGKNRPPFSALSIELDKLLYSTVYTIVKPGV